MKIIYKITTFILAYFCMLNVSTVNAQCGPAGFLFPSTPITPTGVFTAPSTCSWGGDYMLINVIAGNNYSFSTCTGDGRNVTWDSQLTLWEESTLNFIAYSDDDCSLQSFINWTATFTGVVRLNINQFNCVGNSICSTVMLRNNSIVSYNPCTTILSSVPCGSINSTTIASGNGAFSLSPWFPVGKEYIYTFTPAVSGSYTITQSVNTVGTYIDYYFKPTSGGCNGSGWTFIQDIFGTGTSFGSATLTAGVQYYIMLDPENTAGGSVSWSLNCPTYNPCASIFTSASCNNTNTTNIASGNGAYALGSFAPPGKDYIYTFTPAISGSYTITQSVNTVGTYIDYFFKATSGGCNNSGWTLFADINGTGTSFGSATMTAGVQYYIMLDPENTAGGTVTWQLNCVYDPCSNIIPLASCGNSNTTVITPGLGAFSLPPFNPPSQEKIYSYTPPVTGAYSISVTSNSYGYWTDFFYMQASSACYNTGSWIFLDDVFNVANSV